jgi:hypothetical protein
MNWPLTIDHSISIILRSGSVPIYQLFTFFPLFSPYSNALLHTKFVFSEQEPTLVSRLDSSFFSRFRDTTMERPMWMFGCMAFMGLCLL